jgi:hypothetical protein
MQNWNAPEDPPVFSFGYNFNTRASLSLPSDFPIIRADTTNDTTIANTMWRWETGIYQTVSGFRTRIGTRVRLLRENLSVYTRSVNYYWGNECAAYLVNIDQLGSNSELLAIPDFPDQARLPSPPLNTQPAFAVRYKNHYFLPHLHNLNAVNPINRVSSRTDFRFLSFPIFWALYALKLAGIAAARKIPLVMEFDHPVEWFAAPRDYVMAGQSNKIPIYEQVRRYLLLTQWLLDFAKPRGLQFIWSGRNGRRYPQTASDNHWWTMLYNTVDSPYESGFGNIGRGYAQAQLKILQANPDVFAMGIHDHTSPPNPGGGLNNGRYATITIYRHSDPGYRFAAPNPIPTQTGNRVINRRVLPKDWAPGTNDFLFPRGRATFVDVNNASVTTAQNYTGRDGTYWAASVFLERNRAEMAALGLPHHGGDNVRYTNNARDTHGGEGYWDAWVEQGFRGFRVVLGDVSFGNVHVSGNPHRLRYRGLQFVPSVVTDFTVPAAGFYHNSVSYSDTAFGFWRLEDSTARELSGASNQWMSDANWRREKGVIAIRRWLSAIVDVSLYSACCWQGTFYAHPCAAVAWVEAIEQALADASPFEGTAGNQYWNGRFISVKEHLLALDAVVQVLSDYLKWGTITELLNLREEVG